MSLSAGGRSAYATNISNFSGLTATWQYQHGTHSDYIAAIHAVIGTLAAIAQSDQTDSGVYIDVAQTEALAALMAPATNTAAPSQMNTNEIARIGVKASP